jgi:hypothetical protein
MQACSKTLVFLLLAAVATAPLAALDFHSQAASHERPAPCHLSTDHDDGGSFPAPAPVSHSCCQGAHHPAILPQNSCLQPSLEAAAQVESPQHAAAVTAFGFFPSFTASDSPPLLSPLRI